MGSSFLQLSIRGLGVRACASRSLQCQPTFHVVLGASVGLSHRCLRKSKPLPSTCPGPHACRTCPSPHSQPRWSLPGQLSCLPHASAAPRTGPCKNPAGQGTSKPGSSWDAWGHQGWVEWSFRGDRKPLNTCKMGLPQSQRTGARGGQPRAGGMRARPGSALTLSPHTKFPAWAFLGPSSW